MHRMSSGNGVCRRGTGEETIDGIRARRRLDLGPQVTRSPNVRAWQALGGAYREPRRIKHAFNRSLAAADRFGHGPRRYLVELGRARQRRCHSQRCPPQPGGRSSALALAPSLVVAAPPTSSLSSLAGNRAWAGAPRAARPSLFDQYRHASRRSRRDEARAGIGKRSPRGSNT